MKHWSIVCAFALLFMLTACASAGGLSPASEQQSLVQVTETEFHIASSVTTFSPGTTYHFVVTNNGQTAHEFMIMPKAMGPLENMSTMDKRALAYVENIVPGQTKSFDYTFSSSTAHSHPEFACYYPGHYEAGMELGVMVNT